MNIVFLDAKTIGEDIDLSGYDKLGTVIKYGFSTTEEARERTKDADVVKVIPSFSAIFFCEIPKINLLSFSLLPT